MAGRFGADAYSRPPACRLQRDRGVVARVGLAHVGGIMARAIRGIQVDARPAIGADHRLRPRIASSTRAGLNRCPSRGARATVRAQAVDRARPSPSPSSRPCQTPSVQHAAAGGLFHLALRRRTGTTSTAVASGAHTAMSARPGDRAEQSRPAAPSAGPPGDSRRGRSPDPDRSRQSDHHGCITCGRSGGQPHDHRSPGRQRQDVVARARVADARAAG